MKKATPPPPIPWPGPDATRGQINNYYTAVAAAAAEKRAPKSPAPDQELLDVASPRPATHQGLAPEALPVPAPVGALRAALDDAAADPRAAWRNDPLPEARPSAERRPCTAPTLVQGRENAQRRAEVAGMLMQLVEEAGLKSEARAVALELDQHALVDGRSYLELLLESCKAEVCPGWPLHAVLYDAFRKPKVREIGMNARSRFFFELKQQTKLSTTEIAALWGSNHHDQVMSGLRHHERRLAREPLLRETQRSKPAAPVENPRGGLGRTGGDGPAERTPAPPASASRAVPQGDAGPTRERWVEEEPYADATDAVDPPARAGGRC